MMNSELRPSKLAPVRMGVVAIAGSVIALSAWAWLAPLHSSIVAMGIVKAVTNRKLVQHTEGGVVKRLLVRDGDTVREGQTLVELEDVKVDSNYLMLKELIVFEAARHMRLSAEQTLATGISASEANEGIAQRLGPVDWLDKALVEKAYQRELRIFKVRHDLLDQQLASYKRQLLAIGDEQAALVLQMEHSRTGVKLARDEMVINEQLVKDQFVPRLRMIAAERTVADYGAKQGEHEAALAQSEQRKGELNLRMASVRSEYQRTAAEDFKDSSARLVQLREQLRPAEESARRKLVLAPASGRIVGLRLNAPGEVAPPREALMEVVPDNEALVVEAHSGVDSINHLRTNQSTDIRFTGFNSRTTPMVRGRVTYVSADALLDKSGTPFYVFHVQPDSESLRNADISALRPGMAAEVFVLAERRSVVNYLFSPVSDTLRRALREP